MRARAASARPSAHTGSGRCESAHTPKRHPPRPSPNTKRGPELRLRRATQISLSNHRYERGRDDGLIERDRHRNHVLLRPRRGPQPLPPPAHAREAPPAARVAASACARRLVTRAPRQHRGHRKHGEISALGPPRVCGKLDGVQASHVGARWRRTGRLPAAAQKPALAKLMAPPCPSKDNAPPLRRATRAVPVGGSNPPPVGRPVCCILWSRSESGTGSSGPLDGSADTFGGWGYLLGS